MTEAQQHPGDRLKQNGERGMLGVRCRSRADEHIMNTLGRRNLLSPMLKNGIKPKAIIQLSCT